jgi:TRAP-type mannitol/chloroaromatic compound transport system substrate-binding protein
MEIQVFGAGELIPAFETFYAVSTGVAEIGNGAGYYWAGMLPAAQFFASVPFGMNAQQMNAWILGGGGQALWEELYAPLNLLPMASGNTGVQMGGWFNREINAVADLKGLKMRMPGLGGKVLSEAGGTAIQVAGGEIYTNLERGVIDATEWVGPYHDYKMGFYKIAKYYYYPGWHEAGTTLETIFCKSKFDALPTDLQQILRTASMRQNIWTLSEFEAKNSEYLDKLINEEHVDIRAFPVEVIETMRILTRKVTNELTESDPKSRKVYEAYTAYLAKARKWADISEKVYYDLLSAAPSL